MNLLSPIIPEDVRERLSNASFEAIAQGRLIYIPDLGRAEMRSMIEVLGVPRLWPTGPSEVIEHLRDLDSNFALQANGDSWCHNRELLDMLFGDLPPIDWYSWKCLLLSPVAQIDEYLEDCRHLLQFPGGVSADLLNLQSMLAEKLGWVATQHGDGTTSNNASDDQQYLRARWYDPSSGRFTSFDAYEGDPQSPL